MQVKKQQLEPDMEQPIGSKLGKEYVKAEYRHPAYWTCMQSEWSEVKVVQSCLTLLTHYIVHGILQARILEWVVPFPRGSPQPRDQTQVSPIAGEFFTSWATREAKEASLSLLQWIFPTQKSNQGLLHCRQIFYQLSYHGHHMKCQTGCLTSWNQDCHEKYQQPQIRRWYHSSGIKWRGTKEPLDEGKRGEWKSCPKA